MKVFFFYELELNELVDAFFFRFLLCSQGQWSCSFVDRERAHPRDRDERTVGGSKVDGKDKTEPQ
jgi:hypothetical protein